MAVSGPLQNSVFSGYLSAEYGTHVRTLVQVEEIFVAIGACINITSHSRCLNCLLVSDDCNVGYLNLPGWFVRWFKCP